MDGVVNVDIWSDVICPWCYIGKRRFDRAVAELEADPECAGRIAITYRPYQLDPRAPQDQATPAVDAYAKKFGGLAQAEAIITKVTAVAAGDGLEFRMDRAVRANTLASHRLIWLADQPDNELVQAEMKERLLQAYFIDGLNLGDTDTLIACASDVGADKDMIAEFLASDRGMDELTAQLNSAAELGITGVPAYVIDGQWSIPGAQDTDVFVQILRKLIDRRR
jgi:predicted DsbA family dithiol-disulfide isomerase